MRYPLPAFAGTVFQRSFLRALAQSDTASIFGWIAEQTGLALGSARVQVDSVEAAVDTSTKTNVDCSSREVLRIWPSSCLEVGFAGSFA